MLGSRQKVDVLVVGLGPAGGAAALAAAQAGLRVAAVERRKEIGMPVQCAEFIPLPLARYAMPEGVLQQRIQGMISHLPSGTMEKSDTPGLMIDRAAFDQALALQAGQSGARLHLNSRLVGLDSAGSSAIVVTPQGEICFRLPCSGRRRRAAFLRRSVAGAAPTGNGAHPAVHRAAA